VPSPPASAAPALAISELALHARVPRGDPVGEQAAQLFRSITDVELKVHLAEACAGLMERDPEAVWMVRGLEVHTRVPASETDFRAQVRRIAGSVARAIGEAIAGEQRGGAARFASRADHVAQFVTAARRGAAGSWVFAPFQALALLPPTVGLPLACRLDGVSPWEVITLLARSGEWRHLLVGASEADLIGLDRTLARLALTAPTSREVVDAVSAAAVDGAGEGERGLPPAVRRLLMVGRVLIAFDGSARHAAAAWLADGVGRGSPGEPGSAAAASPPTVAAAAVARHDAAPAEHASERAGTDASGVLLAAGGAVAFMLLPGLDDVAEQLGARWLTEPAPEAISAREALLAMAVGRSSELDDAIRLAAGRPLADLGDPIEGDEDAAEPEPRWGQLTPPSPDWPPSPEDRGWLDPDGIAPDGLVLAASAVIRRFLRGLAGFHRAPLSYVMPRVLPCGGMVACTPDLIEVVLPNPPLNVLLQIAGLDGFTCRVPWIASTVVVSHEEWS
jgi:hypothetical protein